MPTFFICVLFNMKSLSNVFTVNFRGTHSTFQFSLSMFYVSPFISPTLSLSLSLNVSRFRIEPQTLLRWVVTSDLFSQSTRSWSTPQGMDFLWQYKQNQHQHQMGNDLIFICICICIYYIYIFISMYVSCWRLNKLLVLDHHSSVSVSLSPSSSF